MRTTTIRAVIAAICVATAFAPFAATAAGNAANPDAIELVPVPWPVKYKGGPDAPVAFDATTTVVVDCPDAVAADWLAAHFREWYGKTAPKVVRGKADATSAALLAGDEAYAVDADASCNGANVMVGV